MDEKDPYSENALTDGAPVPFLVVILITPPIASAPHNILWAPRRISIRSILSVVRLAKLKLPDVALFITAPSMSTRT